MKPCDDIGLHKFQCMTDVRGGIDIRDSGGDIKFIHKRQLNQIINGLGRRRNLSFDKRIVTRDNQEDIYEGIPIGTKPKLAKQEDAKNQYGNRYG